MTVDINEFDKEIECTYKDEVYSVRDNGAICRHPKNTKIRKLDNQWTFGKAGDKGYLYIAGIQVHRIIATAFYGSKPSNEYVVDHIDTNKQNNRPENLRWLTREENVLKNPNTISKIEYITGHPIEDIQQNWDILHKQSSNQNTSWMRPTNKEEAKNFHVRQEQWKTTSSTNPTISIGDWVFNKTKAQKELENNYYPSITPNALQSYYTPTKFYCCPETISDTPIKDYTSKLIPNILFSESKYFKTNLIKYELKDDNTIVVECISINDETETYYSLYEISYKSGYFIHEYDKKYEKIETANKIFEYIMGRIEFDDNDPDLFEYAYL